MIPHRAHTPLLLAIVPSTQDGRDAEDENRISRLRCSSLFLDTPLDHISMAGYRPLPMPARPGFEPWLALDPPPHS